MLKAIFGGLGRWVFVTLFIIATFWPDFGVVPICIRLFPFAPLPVTAFLCAWAVPLALALPLPLKLFRMISTAAIGGVYTVSVVAGYAWGISPLDSAWYFLLGGVAILLGWHVIATPLWRWARGIVAVQDAEAAD